MKFLSLDIETTGLDTINDNIIEIALVAVDTKTHPSTWPTFYKIVAHDRYSGSAFAINMNARIFEQLVKYETKDRPDYVIHIDNLALHIDKFLDANGYTKNRKGTYSVTIAGKNAAGFDIPFLMNAPGLKDVLQPKARVIDIGSLCIDFINDTDVPNLSECKVRAGLKQLVTHNAADDAWDNVMIIGSKMGFDYTNFLDMSTVEQIFIDELNWKELNEFEICSPSGKQYLTFAHDDVHNPFQKLQFIDDENQESFYFWSKIEALNLINKLIEEINEQ